MNSHISYPKSCRGERLSRLLSAVAALGLLVSFGLPSWATTIIENLDIQDINPDRSNFGTPQGASGGRVNGLASVPGNNQVFYAASEWGGLFKSTGSGSIWFRLDRHLPTATWDVEVDPFDQHSVRDFILRWPSVQACIASLLEVW